jgi:hypothetical protein
VVISKKISEWGSRKENLAIESCGLADLETRNVKMPTSKNARPQEIQKISIKPRSVMGSLNKRLVSCGTNDSPSHCAACFVSPMRTARVNSLAVKLWGISQTPSRSVSGAVARTDVLHCTEICPSVLKSIHELTQAEVVTKFRAMPTHVPRRVPALTCNRRLNRLDLAHVRRGFSWCLAQFLKIPV